MNFYLPFIVLIIALCDVTWTTMAENLTPTVHPAVNFNAIADVGLLYNALGFNTDKTAVINLLTHRTFAQRLSIAKEYNRIYGVELKKKLRGLFHLEPKPTEEVVVALVTPLIDYYANELHEATCYLGTDENSLVETLVPLNNSEVRAISDAYTKLFTTKLEDDIRDDTSGDFQKLLVSLCKASRNENPSAHELLRGMRDVRALKTIARGEWSSNGILNTILTNRNFIRLQHMFDGYKILTGRDIEKAIEEEFEAWAGEGYLAIVKLARNKSAYFAERLNAAVSGSGTRDKSLTRIVLGRSEIDLGDIKKEYLRKYGRTLISDIEDDTSDYYLQILQNLVGP